MPINIPQPLIDAVSKKRASLFLGAGASKEADFPDSQDLANYLSEKAGEPLYEKLRNQPLDIVAQHLYGKSGYGEQWVREKIIKLFEEKHQKVPRPVSQAHKLMTEIELRTIFTTNYDRLVEISYDSNQDSVQHLLPIYKPDNQIERHEEEYVRLIKLNGSVDEASRNSNHKLVLTFSDQQDAIKENEPFYRLLKEEAINGPLIFVGFRFTHPGASNMGSSPEFQVLRDLLREMGPSAGWHYCVIDYDPSSEDAQFAVEFLEANNIKVINSTFGDFIEALHETLKHKVPLTKREPINIPVGKKFFNIDAGEYSKDVRQFKILSANDENQEPPTIKDSLNGNENWGSFFRGHFINRLCKDDFLDILRKNFESENPDILLFGARAGWGKTFFLKSIAVELYHSGRPVFWLNPYGSIEVESGGHEPIVIGRWDIDRIDKVIGQIYEFAELNSINKKDISPVIIADNCPERAEEVLSLYMSLSRRKRKIMIIFSVRKTQFEALPEKNLLFNETIHFIPERYDTRQEVRNLIDFCAENGIIEAVDTSLKEIIAQRIFEEKIDIALILALQVIFDKQHRPFSEIMKDLWESLAKNTAKEIVLRVSSLHRFGNIFSLRLYSLLKTFPAVLQSQVLEIYNQCLDEDVLHEEMVEGEPCVHTLHPLVAEKFIDISGESPVEIDNLLIALIENMEGNQRDLEVIRRLFKGINDYIINLSSEDKIQELFKVALETTKNDWVICHQFSNFLLKRDDYETALSWVEAGIETNQNYAPLYHTKGHILSKWGMDIYRESVELLSNDDVKESKEKLYESRGKFQKAREFFAISRVGNYPEEYGYVTHLDMLIYLIEKEKDENIKNNLIAEGIQLYQDGIKKVPDYKFRFLLEARFRDYFDLDRKSTKTLCEKIEKSLLEGKSSSYAAVFLAQLLYETDRKDYDNAIEVLHKQREITDKGILLWVKEAEIHAKESKFKDAYRCIDSAKRREDDAENVEAIWALLYWDLIISFIIDDFKEAIWASKRLYQEGFSKYGFPRGYIWTREAREIDKKERNFKKHAKIWKGRVSTKRISGGQFGIIELSNVIGERFGIIFNPRYFSRKDYRTGDFIEFVVTILPNRIRADDINSKPFINTTDDIYI